MPLIKLVSRPTQGPDVEGRRVAAPPLAGGALGLALGLVLLLAIDRGSISGDASDPFTFVGLPVACLVIGAVLGLLFSAVGTSGEDAPVRDTAALAEGHAAAEPEGQQRGQPRDRRS
jgi:hypothetical protein